jgi:hypothetical protein
MTDAEKKDLAARPFPFLFAWGLPLLAVFVANLFQDFAPPEVGVTIIAAAFAWMGIACLLNAQRCRRRHCYYSGPIFLFGAAALVLVGFGFVPIGREVLNYIVWATFAGVGLSYASEFIWGKYVARRVDE